MPIGKGTIGLIVIAIVGVIIATRGKEISTQATPFFKETISAAGYGAERLLGGSGTGLAIFGKGFGQGIIGVLEPIFWASAKIQEAFK